ncbi:MAG TPA: c-type cytochrome [Gemmatimonadaceae bacterium]|nr:c-type cytochrome [Gemmatimonadaceae bacterium]
MLTRPLVRRIALAACTIAAGAAAACGAPSTDSPAVRQEGAARPDASAAFNPAAWQPPAESAITHDSLGDAVRRGLALVMHTHDSLPAYAPGRLACTNCHINGGRTVDAAPLAGSHARFPKYMDRTGAVIGLADRVNYCFTRSLGGNRLPVESREMQDILAYIAWLSSGVPVGEGKELPGAEGLHAMPAGMTGDSARGAMVFAAKCVACHGADGQGNAAIPPGIPPLWGPQSFSVGASMARKGKAASFIWYNMPYLQGKTLTQQQAFDVAAYITSQPRLDSPGKEHDWPAGGTPADVPYATAGHSAYLPPPLLPRANASQALVPSPSPAQRARGTNRARRGQ